MNNDYEKNSILDNNRPTLSDAERAKMWRVVESALVPAAVVSPYQRFLRPRVVMTALLILIVVSTSSTVAASQSARPGDALFPVEQAVERAQLFIAASEQKDSLRAQHLNERWSELESLMVDKSTSNDEKAARHVAVAVRTLLDQAEVVPEDNRKEIVTKLLKEFEDDSIDERISSYRVRYRDNQIEYRADDERYDDDEEDDKDEELRVRIEDDRIEVRDESYRLRIDDDGEVRYRSEAVDDSEDNSEAEEGDEARGGSSDDVEEVSEDDGVDDEKSEDDSVDDKDEDNSGSGNSDDEDKAEEVDEDIDESDIDDDVRSGEDDSR